MTGRPARAVAAIAGLGLAAYGACAGPPATAPGPSAPGSAAAAPGRPAAVAPCPPHGPWDAGAPPWQVHTRFAACIRAPEGRWTAEADPADVDGWRHFLVFEGAGGRRWRLEVTAPAGMARRLDGGVVVLDLKNGVTLVSPDGAVLWKSSHPYCGAVDAIAVGWDAAITFTCGYSVLRLDADGKLLWQKWPFGDRHTSGPWVDRAGTLYVSGSGKVAALGPDGVARWTFDTGFNRAVGRIAWTPAGTLLFDTSMEALHTSDSDLRIYHDPEPNELFELTRAGKLVRRVKHEGAPPEGWPEVLPLPDDGAHRVPF